MRKPIRDGASFAVRFVAVLCFLVPSFPFPETADGRPQGPPLRPKSQKSAAARESDVLGFRGPNRDGAFPGPLPGQRPRVAWTFATGLTQTDSSSEELPLPWFVARGVSAK